MPTGVVVLPADGEVISDRAERTVVIKAADERVDVTSSRYEPGERGPDPHIHYRHTDAFYVLAGELLFGLGGETDTLPLLAGSLVLIPPGVIHTFGNESASTARFLNFHAPSEGFAAFLRARRDGREIDAAKFDSYDPPAGGGRDPADAIVRGPGTGESIRLGSGGALFKAEGGDGDGTFSLSETTVPAGFPGPVPHRHESFADSFYVLEGTLTVRIESEPVEVGPGGFAFAPPGVAHTFSNPTGTPVRFLNLMAPGGFEQYLKEVARAAGNGASDPRVMAEIASRYDFHPV